jgi:cytosine deaminase
VREAREAGVAISLANDNVADVFVPFGSYELLDAWALGVQMAHLPEPEDWLDMITTTPASVMGLPWDGRLSPGCPADLLWLPATNGLQLVTPAGRRGRVCRAGRWIDAG